MLSYQKELVCFGFGQLLNWHACISASLPVERDSKNSDWLFRLLNKLSVERLKASGALLTVF